EITFDYNYAHEYFKKKDILAKQEEVTAIHAKLHSENSDQTGWVDLPHTYYKSELNRIKEAAEKITAHSDVLLVIGIGGSYLGSKAAIDLFQHHFNDLLPEDAKSKLPYIIFAGQTLSEQYIADVKDILKNKDFSINVISKSGATTEPAIRSDVLLVIGIGGSYLGSKAAIDLFQHHFNDLLPEDAKSKLPYIIFAGQTLSEQYIADVKDILKNKDFSINVISKSGATTEPAI